jgi:hypothetical protein
VQSGKKQPTFRRNISPPSSVLKLEQEISMKQAASNLPALSCFSLGLFFNPEDGDMFLRNVS